mgnify:CR=1 FL=1
MRRKSWFLVIALLGILYYLSSIPSLQVLPVLSQINSLMQAFNIKVSELAVRIADHLPTQLDPVKTVSSDFFNYAGRNPVIIEFILRKAAHITIFFIITMGIFLLVRSYFEEAWKAVLTSFISGTIIAFLDEYHQLFVTGRHGSVIDVYIDMTGVILATLLLIFSFWLTRSHYNRQRRYYY